MGRVIHATLLRHLGVMGIVRLGHVEGWPLLEEQGVQMRALGAAAEEEEDVQAVEVEVAGVEEGEAADAVEEEVEVVVEAEEVGRR